MFSDDDLPDEGAQHNKALYINIVCRQLNVPMTLIDNGSAINVCPLRTARRLGIPQEEFKISNQAIRAYDNTRRDTIGVVWINITAVGKALVARTGGCTFHSSSKDQIHTRWSISHDRCFCS